MSKIITPRQLAANRRNAQSSTGPRTLEGKAASRFNALRHGLAAQCPVIPGENAALYETLRDSFLDQYRPATPAAEVLVHNLALAAWRKLRIANIEAGAFHVAERKLDSDLQKRFSDASTPTRQALLFRADCYDQGVLMKASAYDARVDLALFRTLRRLDQLAPDPDWTERQDDAPAPEPSEDSALPPEPAIAADSAAWQPAPEFVERSHSQNRTPAPPGPAEHSSPPPEPRTTPDSFVPWPPTREFVEQSRSQNRTPDIAASADIPNNLPRDPDQAPHLRGRNPATPPDEQVRTATTAYDRVNCACPATASPGSGNHRLPLSTVVARRSARPARTGRENRGQRAHLNSTPVSIADYVAHVAVRPFVRGQGG